MCNVYFQDNCPNCYTSNWFYGGKSDEVNFLPIAKCFKCEYFWNTSKPNLKIKNEDKIFATKGDQYIKITKELEIIQKVL